MLKEKFIRLLKSGLWHSNCIFILMVFKKPFLSERQRFYGWHLCKHAKKRVQISSLEASSILCNWLGVKRRLRSKIWKALIRYYQELTIFTRLSSSETQKAVPFNQAKHLLQSLPAHPAPQRASKGSKEVDPHNPTL